MCAGEYGVASVKSLDTSSPCVGMCSTALGDAVCIGCQRTFEEVFRWNQLSDQDKSAINARLLALKST